MMIVFIDINRHAAVKHNEQQRLTSSKLKKQSLYNTRWMKFRYGGRRSCGVVGRRTLPRGTLLLVNDDEDHVIGSDVTALDRQGHVFHVPRSSLERFGDSCRGEPWFYPTALTSHQATLFVAAQRQNGCFVVYVPTAHETSTERQPEYVLAVGLSQGEILCQMPTDLSTNFNCCCRNGVLVERVKSPLLILEL